MKKIIRILAGLLTLLLVLTSLVWQTSKTSELKIYFFNIGQGDGMLIRTPTHENIVIDGGPDNSFLAKVGSVLPFYDQTIDLMVLTHPHADHLTGLIPVLERYKVKRVLTSGVIYQSSVYDEWLKLVKQERAEVIYAQAGKNFIFGQVRLLVLSPLTGQRGKLIEEKGEFGRQADNGQNLNNTSVVVKMVYGSQSVLFAGDLEIAGEAALIKSGQDLKADLLKVGHHGSDTATSQGFLAKVSPEYAVIQVGQNNSFGLPDLRVIKLLNKRGIRIWRSDLDGEIIFTLDGREIKPYNSGNLK